MNISRTTKRVLFGSMVLASLLAFLAVIPAYAAPAPRAISPNNTPCNEIGASEIFDTSFPNGDGTNGTVELWESSNSRCVWGQAVNGRSGDTLWVWNANTNAQSSVTLNTGSGSTGEIHDDGTQSHACVAPHYPGAPSKVCTPFH